MDMVDESYMSTLLQPHHTGVLGEVLRRWGISNITLKPWDETR